MKATLLVCYGCAALLVACAVDQPTDPMAKSASPAAKQAAAKSAKVDVCHATGNGSYVKINVAQAAVAAHLAHGDELAGGDVLDGNCEPVQQGEMTVVLPGGATMDFVWIEPGTFTMGSPDSEPDAEGHEKPQHEVAITRGLWLGKCEVTQGQWQSVVGTSPWAGKEYVVASPGHPAVYMSWNDTQGLVAALNSYAGADLYRLPSEAEWEYACRAGTTTRWSYGDDRATLVDYAWSKENTWDAGLQFAQPVGVKLPNPWGLFDMHGNVNEWVQDWYAPYGGEPVSDPRGPITGTLRVMRLGHLNCPFVYTRSGTRNYGTPSFSNYYVGVRLVRIQ